MEVKEKGRDWKSYLTLWISFLLVGIITLWENEFVFDKITLAYVCDLFLIFNGVGFWVYMLIPLIFDKVGINVIVKRLNLIPFIIDVLLMVSSAIVVFEINQQFFYLSIAIMATITIVFLILLRIMLLFPAFNGDKNK